MSFTDEHIILFKNKNKYSVVLDIKSNITKLWIILNEVNQYLYNENTDIIMRDKPVFDKQKRLLILIDAQIINIYSKGLIRKTEDYVDNYDKLSVLYVNENTNYNNWNNQATILNANIMKLLDIINYDVQKKYFKEHKVHSTVYKANVCLHGGLVCCIMIVCVVTGRTYSIGML